MTSGTVDTLLVPLDGTGNARANTIVGNSGRNELAGGARTDILNGNGGIDTFHFAHFGNANKDRVIGIDGSDRIELDSAVFAGLSVKFGKLAANDFFAGTLTEANEAAIIYNASTGNLSYDSDGKGGDAAEIIAFIGKNTTGFDHRDILLV